MVSEDKHSPSSAGSRPAEQRGPPATIWAHTPIRADPLIIWAPPLKCDSVRLYTERASQVPHPSLRPLSTCSSHKTRVTSGTVSLLPESQSISRASKTEILDSLPLRPVATRARGGAKQRPGPKPRLRPALWRHWCGHWCVQHTRCPFRWVVRMESAHRVCRKVSRQRGGGRCQHGRP